MPTRPRRVSRLLAIFVLFVLTVAASAAPAAAYPAFGKELIKASGWMGGQGVAVYSNGQVGGAGRYQCVELAARLYAAKGWGGVRAAGNEGAYYIREGSPDLIFHKNGSGYVPVPGDLIIEHPTASNIYGHVAVVSESGSTTIKTVEQNASSTGWHEYKISGSTITGGYGKVRGTAHSPKNLSSNSPASRRSEGRVDFTGDGKADVVNFGADGRWLVMDNATGKYRQIQGGTKVDPNRILVGDFNGDKKSDVFYASSDGRILVSYGGSTPWVTVHTGTKPDPSRLFVGDFTGDGKADVVNFGADGRWLVMDNATGKYRQIQGVTKVDPNRILVGDFNGDKKSDVFYASSDGRILVSYGGNTPWVTVHTGTKPDPARLRGGF